MMTSPTGEPLIHSHWTDVLPKEDPRAETTIDCSRCGTMVHAFNNECMTTWIEWGPKVLCGECFAEFLQASDGVLSYGEFETYATS